MARKNYRASRMPETEAEELVLYKNLFQLQVVGRRRHEAESEIERADIDAQPLVDLVKPFASWEEIGTALGIPAHVAMTRFTKKKESENDEPD